MSQMPNGQHLSDLIADEDDLVAPQTSELETGLKRKRPSVESVKKRLDFEQDKECEEAPAAINIPIPVDSDVADVSDSNGNHWCFYDVVKASDDTDYHSSIFQQLVATMGIAEPDTKPPGFKRAMDLLDLSALLNTSTELTVPGKSYLYYKHNLAIAYESKNVVTEKNYINQAKLITYTHVDCMEKYKRYQTLLVAKKKIPLKIMNDAKSVISQCKCMFQMDLSSFVGLFKGTLKQMTRSRNINGIVSNFKTHNLILNCASPDMPIVETIEMGGKYQVHDMIQLANLDGDVTRLTPNNSPMQIGNAMVNLRKERGRLNGEVNKDGINCIMQLGHFMAKIDKLSSKIYLSCKKNYFVYEF